MVVLARDIHMGVQGLNWASRAFEGRPLIYVAGNHEGYAQHWLPLMDELRTTAKPPLHFLECSQSVIQGVRFLGATLWTDCYLWGDRSAVLAEQDYLGDFRHIRMDRESDLRLDPVEMIRWHERARDRLANALQAYFDGPTVVVPPCATS